MTATFQIREARMSDCGAISRRLRIGHMQAACMLGLSTHKELRKRFDESYFRHAWTLDGRLAAVGGVTGSTLGADGMIWLAITEEATQHPVAVVRATKAYLDRIMVVKRVLYTAVLADDTKARDLALFLGFHAVGNDVAGQRAYSKAGRRNLREFIESTPEYRTPVGRGYGFLLAYSDMGEAA